MEPNNPTALIIVLIAPLLAVAVGALLSLRLYSHLNNVSAKREVLRRLMGNRYLLTERFKGQGGEVYAALNEAAVVFSDVPQVMAALKKMHEELNVKGRTVDNFITLVKVMAEAVRVPLPKNWNDSFIVQPFSPPPVKANTPGQKTKD